MEKEETEEVEEEEEDEDEITKFASTKGVHL